MNDNTSLNKDNLHDLQGQFFDQLKVLGRSENTLKNYRTDLECFNKYLVSEQENLDLTNFSLPQVLEYGKFLEQKYTSDNSRRRRVQALRMFFDFLVQQSIFDSNPVRKLPTSPKFLDIPRPTSFIDVKTLWVFLLEEEKKAEGIQELIALRNQVVMLLIFGSGLKVSDISTLKVDHIFPGPNPRVLIQHPKRDSYTIPLTPIFDHVFQKYLEKLSHFKSVAGLEFDQILFNANPYKILSGGLSSRGLEVVFEELRKKLQITLTPKSLRQACIFKWLHQKKKENLMKEWLGLAPSYSLKLYKDHMDSHLYNEDFLVELYKNNHQKSS